MKFKILFFQLLFITATAISQTDSNEERDRLIKADQEFWDAYNECNLSSFATFINEDFEFYHDKGGETFGKEKMMSSVKDHLCDSNKPKVRREALTETIEVFPIKNFGFFMTGEHLFYVTEKGKPEKLTQIAKFSHLWKKTDNHYQMTRAISYDHKPIDKN